MYILIRQGKKTEFVNIVMNEHDIKISIILESEVLCFDLFCSIVYA